jgi:hypothetical protein
MRVIQRVAKGRRRNQPRRIFAGAVEISTAFLVMKTDYACHWPLIGDTLFL